MVFTDPTTGLGKSGYFFKNRTIFLDWPAELQIYSKWWMRGGGGISSCPVLLTEYVRKKKIEVFFLKSDQKCEGPIPHGTGPSSLLILSVA